MTSVGDQQTTGDGARLSPQQIAAGVVPSIESPEVRQQRRTDYNRLVRTAKLTSILLEKTDFSTRTESMGISKSLLKRELVATSNVLSSGASDNVCVANIEWSVKYTYQKRAIVKCVSSYIVSFEGMRSFPDEVIAIYVDTNAKGLTYSYFRALYAHLDWSANLGSAPLPIVQLQAKV
jgi:hypothetical protein